MRVRLCCMLAVLSTQLFVPLDTAEMKINFLKHCRNEQIRSIECPKNKITTTDSQWKTTASKRPNFIIGSTWDRKYILYGNISIPIDKARVYIMELVLYVGERLEDKQCFRVIQTITDNKLKVSCLKMVSSNFAKLTVGLVELDGGLKNNSTSKRRIAKLSSREVLTTFNIGQESCKYYNQIADKKIHFTLWKTNKPSRLAFQYTDTFVNSFAMETEVLITERCTVGHHIVYNRTMYPGIASVHMNGTFGMECPQNKLMEIVAETCSYCYKNHEATACFHQTIDLNSYDLDRWGPCSKCSKHAAYQDQHCVCKKEYSGNGFQCWVKIKGQTKEEIIIGAATGFAFILMIILIVLTFKCFKKRKYKMVGTLIPHEQNNKRQNNVLVTQKGNHDKEEKHCDQKSIPQCNKTSLDFDSTEGQSKETYTSHREFYDQRKIFKQEFNGQKCSLHQDLNEKQLKLHKDLNEQHFQLQRRLNEHYLKLQQDINDRCLKLQNDINEHQYNT